MMTIIRFEKVLMTLQMITGISRRDVIKNNNKVLAVRLIKAPEYTYTFASIETL